MEYITAFDIFILQPNGSEQWVDSAESFSGAIFRAEISAIESPGTYVIHDATGGTKHILKLGGSNVDAPQ